MNFDYTGLISTVSSLSQSLKGITGSQYNAKLYIPSGTGTAIIDPETGNYTLSTVSTTTLYAKFKPVQNNGKMKADINIGTPFTRIELEGYLTSPLTSEITLPATIPCDIKFGGQLFSGTFYPTLSIKTNIVENLNIGSALGDNITGFFEISGNTRT